METQQKLSKIVNADCETMASPYIRIAEILDFVQGTFALNIGETARRDIGKMTLDDLRAVLAPRIEHYSKFVATSKPGVFREQDPLEKWIEDGVKAKSSL